MIAISNPLAFIKKKVRVILEQGIESPEGEECPYRFYGQTHLQFSGYMCPFPSVKRQGVMSTTHLQKMSRFRSDGTTAIPPTCVHGANRKNKSLQSRSGNFGKIQNSLTSAGYGVSESPLRSPGSLQEG